MLKSQKSTVARRIGEADPVISMAQRAWDFISGQWPSIAAFFATGGGVTFLAYITNWALALGPLGIGLIVLASSFATMIVFALFQSILAKRGLRSAQADSIRKWNSETSSINPLDSKFHTQRMRISELISPINNRIKNKRFIDCEILGPAVITFTGKSSISGCGFVNCDFAVIREGAWINNVAVFEDSAAIGSTFWGCTIFMPKQLLDKMNEDSIVPVITLTGDPRYDNQPPAGAGQKAQQ